MLRGRFHARLALLAIFTCGLTGTPIAFAGEIRVPLTIDYLTLSAALRTQLYTAPGGRAALWNGADQCQYLFAENPQFGSAGARVKVETIGTLSLGVAVAGRCLSPLSWNGIIETESAPYITPELQVRLRVQDINLYNPQHQKTLLAGKGFDLVKQYFIPRLETFTFDLRPAVEQLAMLAEEASPPEVAARVKTAVETIRAEPEVAPGETGIRITLVITTPDFATPAAGPIAAASAPATPQEIAAFEKQLDQWDAFLVFAVKQLGETVGDKVFRAQLLEILLDSRFKLVQALQSPPSASGPDPVRIVFLDEWQQLGDAVRAAAGRGALGSRGLEFLSFISAGDALFALDQAAPALGLRISDGDLRRLAHIMAPEAKGDPLQFSNGEDPELQRLFGTTEPLSNPEAMEQNPEAAESEEPSPAAATASGEPTPATAGAPAAGSTFSTPVVTGTPKAPSSISERSIPAEGPAAAPAVSGSPPAPSGTSTPAPAARSSWLMLLEPAGAYAADSPPPGGSVLDDLRKLAKLLQRAVPNQDNVDGYRNDMQSLLDLSATREIDAGAIDPRYRPLFTQMVRAAAWQESCWRQFVRSGGRVRWLESSTGDVGLMQVNKHVWRGFYNLDKLRWDVLYNAGAGCEILTQLMGGVIDRSSPQNPPSYVEVARSTYAAYNGGPGAYKRWRRHEPEPMRSIDGAFYQKFRAVAHGQSFDILTCAADWGHTAGH